MSEDMDVLKQRPDHASTTLMELLVKRRLARFHDTEVAKQKAGVRENQKPRRISAFRIDTGH
jgi:hypothetical protein